MNNDEAITLILILVALTIYFFPWLIALNRKHRQKAAIFVLNLFLGWTLLGWVISLVWALIKDRDF